MIMNIFSGKVIENIHIEDDFETCGNEELIIACNEEPNIFDEFVCECIPAFFERLEVNDWVCFFFCLFLRI